jgi:hypothetical protein
MCSDAMGPARTLLRGRPRQAGAEETFARPIPFTSYIFSSGGLVDDPDPLHYGRTLPGGHPDGVVWTPGSVFGHAGMPDWDDVDDLISLQDPDNDDPFPDDPQGRTNREKKADDWFAILWDQNAMDQKQGLKYRAARGEVNFGTPDGDPLNNDWPNYSYPEVTGIVILDLEDHNLDKAAVDVREGTSPIVWDEHPDYSAPFEGMASTRAQWQEAIEFLLTRWHRHFVDMFPNARAVVWYNVPPMLNNFNDMAQGVIDRDGDEDYEYLMRLQRLIAMRHYQHREAVPDETPPPLPNGIATATNVRRANQAAIDRGLKFASKHGVPLMVFTFEDFIPPAPLGRVSTGVLEIMRQALASRPYVSWFGTLGTATPSPGEIASANAWLTEKWLKEFG